MTPSEGSEAFHPRDTEPMVSHYKPTNKIKFVMAAFHWSEVTWLKRWAPSKQKNSTLLVDKMTGRLSRRPLANKSVYTLKPVKMVRVELLTARTPICPHAKNSKSTWEWVNASRQIDGAEIMISWNLDIYLISEIYEIFEIFIFIFQLTNTK